MVQDTLTAAEADDLAVLSDLVAPYEAMTHAIPLPSDADLLQYLLDARGVTPPEVAQATGIGAATLAAALRSTLSAALTVASPRHEGLLPCVDITALTRSAPA